MASTAEAQRIEKETSAWTIDDSRELYNLDGWGIGYFSINEQGHITVHPTKEPDRGFEF